MARPRCPHAHPSTRPGADPPLRSTDEALQVMTIALAGHRRGAAVIPLDAERHGTRIITVDDLPHDDAVLEVLDLTLAAHVAGGSPMRALVLASSRPSVLGWPTPDDWWRYGAACERCQAAGVDLLDWVLLGSEGAVSLAELDGRPEARWAPC